MGGSEQPKLSSTRLGAQISWSNDGIQRTRSKSVYKRLAKGNLYDIGFSTRKASGTMGISDGVWAS